MNFCSGALGLYEKALMLLLVEENLEKLKEFKMEPHEYLKNRFKFLNRNF